MWGVESNKFIKLWCSPWCGGDFMLDCNAIYMLLDKDPKITKIQQEIRESLKYPYFKIVLEFIYKIIRY